MIVDKERVKEYKDRISRLEKEAKIIEKHLTDTSLNKGVIKILEKNQQHLKRDIVLAQRGLKWEESKYNYLGEDAEKLNELASYLGKEVHTHLRCDKSTPQILLGLYWKDAYDPNYERSRWVANIRYWLNGYSQDGEIGIQLVTPKAD
jgi:hypothetical protein